MKRPRWRPTVLRTAVPCLLIGFATAWLAQAKTPIPDGPAFTNSLGMRFVRIAPGSFDMGHAGPLSDALLDPLTYPTRSEMRRRFPGGDPAQFRLPTSHVRQGDFDERPVHRVRISRPFYIGVHEVTNAEYEQFDPAHRAVRGRRGFSSGDDDAVVFVSWHDAKAFVEWLSRKEGLPYRLPTEAEWEYAARAGTTTSFWTGETLPEAFLKNPRNTTFIDPSDIVPLTVGKTPANPWGLFDVHGNVEEWCEDWYGPYLSGDQTEPIGPAAGTFKVTRGGSHGTFPYYLRSANRLGTLPEDEHWLIGFRVVLGEPPSGEWVPAEPAPALQRAVEQESAVPTDLPAPDRETPYFRGPRRYVRIPKGADGPLFSHHNHDPAIAEAPNGDLIAIWYTTAAERGRELAVAGSRLRRGADEWGPASLFWDAPDRNDHCPALWFDGDDTIYHFNGLSTAGMWEPLAIVMRTSRDSGATWSTPRLVVPEHGYRQMVGEPVFRMQDGAIAFGADAGRGSTIWLSRDDGATWSDPGGTIHGIHAGIVQLEDGRLFALGRGMDIDGRLPQSVSSDGGRSWEASASPFPAIGGGQRLVLIRLKEGPLFLASFARDLWKVTAADGDQRPLTTVFGAVSYDEGRTWPVRRWITGAEQDQPGETIDGGPIRMGPATGEPQGYLSATQTADGVIQLISSQNHYAFNVAWLEARLPAPADAPVPKPLEARARLSRVYTGGESPADADPAWRPVGGSGDLVKRGLRLVATGDRRPRWTNERLGVLTDVDPQRGFTAEIRAQVPRSAADRGLDLEVQLRGGALTVNRYLLTITASGVQYWHDGRFVTVAEGLDNAGGPHAFRIAVRPDTAVQIYRDGALLGTWPMDMRVDWRQPARGSYIEWGLGASETEAVVSDVSFDAWGAWRP